MVEHLQYLSWYLTTIKQLFSEGLLNKEMVDFCSPPKRARLANLYFLKKYTSPLWEYVQLSHLVIAQQKIYHNSLTIGYNP